MTYTEKSARYIDDVLAGDTPACKLVRLACQRQRDDLKRDWEYEYNEPAANLVCQFVELLPHIKGKWARDRQLIHLEDWQCFILCVVFGWLKPDGTRRFSRAFNEWARKNGKSLIASAVGLYLLTLDGEEGAEIYSCATKRDQAKIVFDVARAMARKSPRFRARFGVDVQKYNLNVPHTSSKFEPVASDSDGLEGLNPHGALIDELHVHKDRTVYDVMVTALGSRDNALVWIITTAGEFAPQSIGYQEHQYAVGVLEGSMPDDNYFAFIAAADKDDDPFDKGTWEKANPNYGVSVRKEYIAQQARKAKNQPSFRESFLRYHLNLWVQAAERWLPTEKWMACGGEFDEDELVGQTCYAGLDMAKTTDVAALVYVFPAEWRVLCRFFVPQEAVTRRSRADRVPYDTWSKLGLITATPGDVVDYKWVRRCILQDAEQFDLRELWYDPWNLTQFAVELQDEYGLEVIECRQGLASMNEPCKALERLVMSGDLQHGDNPVLTWMAANAVVRVDESTNIRPDKKRSREKIDGIVALAMAVGAANKGGGGEWDVYDDHEPLVISL